MLLPQSGAQAPLPDANASAAGDVSAADRDAAGDAGPGPGSAAAAASAAQQGQAQGKESLLAAAAKARKERPAETEAEAALREEAEIMRNITARMALKSVKENAQVRTSSCERYRCRVPSACMCCRLTCQSVAGRLCFKPDACYFSSLA